jgi:hypothetical protein
MRHRISDHLCGLHLPLGRDTRSLAADPKYSDFYTEDEIKLLKYTPPPMDPADIAVKRHELLR